MTPPVLTAVEKSFFESNGYLSLPAAADVLELAQIRHLLARLVEHRTGFERGDFLDLAGDDANPEEARLPQILMPVNYLPELASFSLPRIAREIARQLLGDPIIAEGEHMILKPPRTGAYTPLHQDEAFWSDETDYQSVSVWFPLQDVDASNGCLHFVPGSHKGDVLPHHSVENNPQINGLEVDHPQAFHPVEVPLKIGGLTVHHCRTLHGGPANTSSEPRYAYIFGFGLPAKPARVPRNYYWLKNKNLYREKRAQELGYQLTKMHPELEGAPTCS